MLVEKRESLKNMKYWNLYIKNRNYFPDEEDEELPAQDLIEKIIQREKSDILHGKICETIGINP